MSNGYIPKALRARVTIQARNRCGYCLTTRQQLWSAHFAWNDGADRIVGITAIGRATVVALRLNRPLLVRSRKIGVAAGLHPPLDDELSS